MYHRLSVILIESPALKTRKDDIELLINFFTEDICKEQGFTSKEFTTKSIEALSNYNWPGNIRELRNVTERLLILGETQITEDDVNRFVLR